MNPSLLLSTDPTLLEVIVKCSSRLYERRREGGPHDGEGKGGGVERDDGGAPLPPPLLPLNNISLTLSLFQRQQAESDARKQTNALSLQKSFFPSSFLSQFKDANHLLKLTLFALFLNNI